MNLQTVSNLEIIVNLFQQLENADDSGTNDADRRLRMAPPTRQAASQEAEEALPTAEAITEQTVWFEPPGTARSGTFRGTAEIVKHAAKCMALTDGTWGNDVVEILGGEEYVVVIERELALRNGTSLNMLCNVVYQMSEGSITEIRVLPFDPPTWNAFWA